ncbi:hypothetical protein [Rhodocista pekingensis]|uniref:Uncharacterized protein n=1 Tax=Rhodocista pekingensis TaxID=201185 RepID=A0ABW2KYX2_9PROT
MPWLFHQNMRRFGGGAVARNQAYQTAFQNLVTGAGSAPSVAGFTEIVNNIAAQQTMAAITANQMGMGFYLNVAIGQTALANGPEYIGVAVQDATTITGIGRITIHADGLDVGLIHDPFTMQVANETQQQRTMRLQTWSNNLPGGTTPDTRGLAYVVIANGNSAAAVGFMHNMYTFEEARALTAGKLPGMARFMRQAMVTAVPNAASYLTVIGGDFNVAPIEVRGTARQGRIFAYDTPCLNPPPGAMAGGTTWFGNLYDYWYLDLQPTGGGGDPVPGTYPDTMDNDLMSDHCGITLQF